MKLTSSKAIVFSSFLSLAIFGCGGGGNGTEYLSGIPVSCKQSAVDDGDTISAKAATSGLIGIDCNSNDNPFFLKNGTPSLNITKITRDFNITATCDNKNISISGMLDFNSGVYDLKGTGTDGNAVNCQLTFTPASLPTTISSRQSITQLLVNYADDPINALTNSCQSNTPTNTDNVDCTTLSNATLELNYNITDDNNAKHEIITSIEINN